MLFAACATTDDDTVVPVAIPCIAGNASYEVGESYDQDCNICTCQADGSFSCTEMACEATCWCDAACGCAWRLTPARHFLETPFRALLKVVS